jgi:hypothetical protein
MMQLVQWKGADGEALPSNWNDFRKELDELLLRFFGENLPVSAIIVAAFDRAGENGNRERRDFDNLSATAFQKLSAANVQRLTAMDIVRALNDRDLNVLDNFSRLQQAVGSVSNEEVLELKQALRATLPWLEERFKRLKTLAAATEERYSALNEHSNV